MSLAHVAALPAQQRQLVELTWFGGLSYRAAAGCLGLPLGTAKGRLRAALLRLAELLADEQPALDAP